MESIKYTWTKYEQQVVVMMENRPKAASYGQKYDFKVTMKANCKVLCLTAGLIASQAYLFEVLNPSEGWDYFRVFFSFYLKCIVNKCRKVWDEHLGFLGICRKGILCGGFF